MDQDKVSKFIKEIRIRNDLTQKEFAKMLNVTYQAVSKWERGLNHPDIFIMMEISKLFNVDISEILNGEKNKNLKSNKKKYIILIILLIGIIFFIYIFKRDNNFKFRQISSYCDDFELTGSAAYNKDKSSIYISNVSYCGNNNDTVYKELECNLYEDNKLIRTCEIGNNKTLEEYLKDIRISVNDYKSSCKTLENANLYLEINGYDLNNNITSYKIPINLDDNCDIQP